MVSSPSTTASSRDELQAVLEKYFAICSDTVIAPMLSELDMLERKWLAEFREKLKDEDPELAAMWFATAIKRVTLAKAKIEDRHRAVERAVADGF